MPLVEVRGLTKIYGSESSVWRGTSVNHGIRAVSGVSLDIHPGETLGLVGESGCGKTTLGRMILRLVEPSSGSIRYDGTDVLTASLTQMRRLRRDMQIIFQDPFASLNPRMKISEILTEPLVIHRQNTEQPASAERLRETAEKMVEAVGLPESTLDRYPHEFSGGQRQRIGIARALILRPKFVVCDEPVSALDVSVGAQIVNLLKSLQREFGLTFLFISHSMPVVRYLSDRIAVMRRGEIVEMGSTEQIVSAPAQAYTRSLLAATPKLAFS